MTEPTSAACIRCGGTDDLRDRGMAPGMTYCAPCRKGMAAAEVIDAHICDSLDTDYRVNADGESIIDALRSAGYVIGSYNSPHGIEQSRRDFMRDYPELYGYIALREQAKALDSAGDHISGHHEAANRVWALAAAADAKWRAIHQKIPPPPPPPIGGVTS